MTTCSYLDVRSRSKTTECAKADLDSSFQRQMSQLSKLELSQYSITDSPILRCSAQLFLITVPAHHSAPSSAALAEGSRADCIQTVSPRVQVSTRVRTCYLLTSFVRWQMSRLVSDSVPVHLHHWLSAAPDSLLSVTKLSRSPLHVSGGTVCQILSLPHLP